MSISEAQFVDVLGTTPKGWEKYLKLWKLEEESETFKPQHFDLV